MKKFYFQRWQECKGRIFVHLFNLENTENHKIYCFSLIVGKDDIRPRLRMTKDILFKKKKLRFSRGLCKKICKRYV